MPPTIHKRVRWANIPTIIPATKLIAKAACLPPGAEALSVKWINTGAVSKNTNKTTAIIGKILPSNLGNLYVLFKLYPLFKKNTPAIIPAINPTKPKIAFKSPPAKRNIILKGQPKNIKQPIITKNANIKRVNGELPPLALNSFLATAIIKLPKIKPIISGRIYWTVAVECKPKPPAVSRKKQAIQKPIFIGLPK